MPRTSLYFSPESWWAMNNMLSLTALSGLPVLELPTMNDLIEDMVIFTGWIVDSHPDSIEDLLVSAQGGVLTSIKSEVYLPSNATGRMAFNVSEKAMEVLDHLNSVVSSIKEKDTKGTFYSGMSIPMLIRNCVYFVLNGPYLFDFFMWFYVSSLYGLTLFKTQPSRFLLKGINETSPEKNSILDIISSENEYSKDSLKLISMDSVVINSLRRIIENMLENQREIMPNVKVNYPSGTNIEMKFDPAKMKGVEYASRFFNFNYYETAYGFSVLLHFNPLTTTIPEIMVRIGRNQIQASEDNFLWMQHFLRTLSLFKDISIDYNRLISEHGEISFNGSDTKQKSQDKPSPKNTIPRLILDKDVENQRLMKDVEKHLEDMRKKLEDD